jgi:hypothetical protein
MRQPRQVSEIYPVTGYPSAYSGGCRVPFCFPSPLFFTGFWRWPSRYGVASGAGHAFACVSGTVPHRPYDGGIRSAPRLGSPSFEISDRSPDIVVAYNDGQTDLAGTFRANRNKPCLSSRQLGVQGEPTVAGTTKPSGYIYLNRLSAEPTLPVA